MNQIWVDLTQEEATIFVGAYFTRPDTAFGRKVSLIEKVGRNGTCWYRELPMKVISRSPKVTLPCGGETIPSLTLTVDHEQVNVNPLRRAKLVYNFIPVITAGAEYPYVEMKCCPINWQFTERNETYPVIERGWLPWAKLG